VSVASRVPTVMPGLDDALYREAEARHQRQVRREEEAEEQARQNRIPRLSRESRALFKGRLERELRTAFESVCSPGCGPEQPGCGADISVQRQDLPRILEALGLLCGTEGEETFCAKLAMLLDREETGKIGLEKLLGFLLCALDREARDQRSWSAAGAGSLEEVCFSHLEQQLSRAVGRLLSNRLSRPRTDVGGGACRRASSASSAASTADGSWSTGAFGGPKRPQTSQTTKASQTLARDFARVPPSPRRSQERPWNERSRGGDCCGGGSVGSWAGSTPRAAWTAQASAPSSPSAPRRRPRPNSATSAVAARAQSGCRQRGGVDDPSLARCHLLYQQAVFASRESAQLGEEIKSLRHQEEMRECTFRPKLLSSRRPRSPAPTTQPRNFEAAVARMRTAHHRRQEHRRVTEHIPCGENYERLRRLGSQPFSCYYDERPATARRPVLLYIDVNVGNGRTGRIGVHEGDDLRVLSRNFAKAFQLDADMELRLEEMLRQACEERQRLEFDGRLADVANVESTGACDAPSGAATWQGSTSRQSQLQSERQCDGNAAVTAGAYDDAFSESDDVAASVDDAIDDGCGA